LHVTSWISTLGAAFNEPFGGVSRALLTPQTASTLRR
jgi:hypothetical protein